MKKIKNPILGPTFHDNDDDDDLGFDCCDSCDSCFDDGEDEEDFHFEFDAAWVDACPICNGAAATASASASPKGRDAGDDDEVILGCSLPNAKTTG